MEGTINEDHVLVPLTVAAAFSMICVVGWSHEYVMTIGVGPGIPELSSLLYYDVYCLLLARPDSLCKSCMAGKAGIAF